MPVMQQAKRSIARYLAPLSLAALLALPVVGCSSLTAGDVGDSSSADTSEPEGPYTTEIPYRQVVFSDIKQSQAIQGLSVTLSVSAPHPDLYYRYLVTSQVNGSYVMMSGVPRVYTVRKMPFYKSDSEGVVVRMQIKNDTDKVLSMAQAVCSFDISGKTVSTTPLNSTDLLPGHDEIVVVRGPTPEQLSANTSGSLVIWVYGVGDNKSQTMRWDTAYTVTDEQRQAQADMMRTTSKDVAEKYEGREDAADSRDEPPPAPGGTGPG